MDLIENEQRKERELACELEDVRIDAEQINHISHRFPKRFCYKSWEERLTLAYEWVRQREKIHGYVHDFWRDAEDLFDLGGFKDGCGHIPTE